MSTLLWLLIFAVAGTALAYRKTTLVTSTAVIGALLLVLSIFGDVAWGWLLLFWLVFAGIAAVLNVDSLRKQLLTAPAFKFFKNVLPEMSDTERAALEAGTVWWEGDLFSGNPDWYRLGALPRPRLSEEEQAFLDGPVEELCGMLDDWQIVHEDADLSPQAWEFIKKNKFFGMIIPKQYGGLEFSAVAHSAVLTKVASAGGTTASSIVAVPNSLGPAELLLHYGTDEQKNHYLPRLATGEEIPCFGLTSPYAGSDAGSIPDMGVVCEGTWKGKKTLGMRLTFDKRYITLAPVATVIGLAFKLYDPDHLLGEQEDLGITCALVPHDTKGVEIGRRHYPLAAPFMNGPIRGKDVFVPLDTIIGGQQNAGRGWRMLMEVLSVGRGISLPSGSTGGALQAAFATGAYARVRKQFNVSIGEFEGIQEAMARIGARAYACDSVRQMSALAVDLGEKPSVSSGIAKMHVTDLARKIAIDAMDVHSGKAVCIGPKNVIANGYQSAPVAITVEGANILTRSMMIYGQGAIRCHPYVLREMDAVADEDAQRGLDNFDTAFMGHLGHVASAKARSFALGLTGSRLASAPVSGPTAIYYKRLARYSANLALLSDVSMGLLGGSLKFRESISARLGDVLSALFIGSAVLKRYQDDGRPEEDLPLVQWMLDDLCHGIEDSLDGVLNHLPMRPVMWGLRLVIFPLGRRARAAGDDNNRSVSKLMMEPAASMDRLAHAVYKPDSVEHPLGVLRKALTAVLETEKLELKLVKAYKAGELKHPHPRERIDEAKTAGLISADEAKALIATWDLVAEVVAVDEFTTEDMQAGRSVTARGEKPKAKPKASAARKTGSSRTRTASKAAAGKSTKSASAKSRTTKRSTAKSGAAKSSTGDKPADSTSEDARETSESA
ncbi:acyl-CoA dehydrogenase [uncultured Abyssibacter sp.]|uniref:acyl-CoA dehydrogenase n=1 Tax=uncultured Abyssibacter sp. TaxID=2320202 RepID=UPI0032B157CF